MTLIVLTSWRILVIFTNIILFGFLSCQVELLLFLFLLSSTSITFHLWPFSCSFLNRIVLGYHIWSIIICSNEGLRFGGFSLNLNHCGEDLAIVI